MPDVELVLKCTVSICEMFKNVMLESSVIMTVVDGHNASWLVMKSA